MLHKTHPKIEVTMNKHLFGLTMMSACLFAGSAMASSASTIESETLPSLSQGTSPNIERVLSELTKQHNNASSLVKSARQPTTLALNSSLLSHAGDTFTNGVTDDLIKGDSLVSSENSDSNVLERLTAVASNTVSKFKQTGLASWYGRKFHGRKTASGDIFDMNALTAAHRSLPLNCYVKVTNKSNGKSVVVKVNDRGPFHGSRVLDLSYGAAKAIGLTKKGVGNVTVERVEAP